MAEELILCIQATTALVSTVGMRAVCTQNSNDLQPDQLKQVVACKFRDQYHVATAIVLRGMLRSGVWILSMVRLVEVCCTRTRGTGCPPLAMPTTEPIAGMGVP
jgi:hypothetical protein